MSQDKIRIRINLTLIRYLTVGIANTVLGLSVIFLGKWILGLGDISANALGYACGLVLSFFLNSKWTFVFQGSTFPAMIRFILIIGTAYSINLATVITAIEFFNVNSYFAQVLGIIPYTTISYLGMRYLAFPIANCKPA